MPGSGPPEPDATLVLNAIRNGATWVPQRAEWGGLDVDGVVQRLAIERALVGFVWRLDPDSGSLIDQGTYETLAAWATSASRDAPISFDEGQLFALGLIADSVSGTPIARVVVIGPAVLDVDPLIKAI
jgi:hypothetical protein